MLLGIILQRLCVLLALLCGMFLAIQGVYSLLRSEELLTLVDNPKTYTFIVMLVFVLFAVICELFLQKDQH